MLDTPHTIDPASTPADTTSPEPIIKEEVQQDTSKQAPLKSKESKSEKKERKLSKELKTKVDKMHASISQQLAPIKRKREDGTIMEVHISKETFNRINKQFNAAKIPISKRDEFFQQVEDKYNETSVTIPKPDLKDMLEHPTSVAEKIDLIESNASYIKEVQDIFDEQNKFEKEALIAASAWAKDQNIDITDEHLYNEPEDDPEIQSIQEFINKQHTSQKDLAEKKIDRLYRDLMLKTSASQLPLPLPEDGIVDMKTKEGKPANPSTSLDQLSSFSSKNSGFIFSSERNSDGSIGFQLLKKHSADSANSHLIPPTKAEETLAFVDLLTKMKKEGYTTVRCDSIDKETRDNFRRAARYCGFKDDQIETYGIKSHKDFSLRDMLTQKKSHFFDESTQKEWTRQKDVIKTRFSEESVEKSKQIVDEIRRTANPHLGQRAQQKAPEPKTPKAEAEQQLGLRIN